LLLSVAKVFPAEVAATASTTAKTISNAAIIAAFAIFDVPAAISIATAFAPLRNRYCTAENVFTAAVAATDSTTAETISNTAKFAALAIFDVPAAISNDTAFSLLRNCYCLLPKFSLLNSLLPIPLLLKLFLILLISLLSLFLMFLLLSVLLLLFHW